MDKEIKSLTGIRGIAAMWVVFLHYFESLGFDKDLYISKLFSNGIVAVDIFFLLSAFVMCIAYSSDFSRAISIQSYKIFIKKRFVRIYPAYFFWVVAFLFVFDFVSLKFDFGKILVNLLLIQNFFYDSVISGVFWSLSSEWLLYLVFPFLYFVIYSIRVVYLNIFLILICMVGVYTLPSMNNYFIDFHQGLYVTLPSGFIGVVTGVNSILRCFFAYVVGINLFLLIRRYNHFPDFLPDLLIYFSVCVGLVVVYFGKSAETYTFLFMVSVLLISGLYLNKEDRKSIFSSEIIYFMGKISYSIYLSHMFILIFVTIFVKKFFPLLYESDVQMYLVSGSLLLLIPLSYLSYTYFETKAGLWLKAKLIARPSAGGILVGEV